MRKNSATYYLLSSLVPYTDANLRLSFKPSSFFSELEKRERIKHQTLQTAYQRALNNGNLVIGDDKIPRLTDKGIRALAPFQAKQLDGAGLMVIFDVPEADKAKRQQLRTTLKEFRFKHVQKSVWMSDLDCQGYIQDAIKELELDEFVQMFEAKRITK